MFRETTQSRRWLACPATKFWKVNYLLGKKFSWHAITRSASIKLCSLHKFANSISVAHISRPSPNPVLPASNVSQPMCRSEIIACLHGHQIGEVTVLRMYRRSILGKKKTYFSWQLPNIYSQRISTGLAPIGTRFFVVLATQVHVSRFLPNLRFPASSEKSLDFLLVNESHPLEYSFRQSTLNQYNTQNRHLWNLAV